MQCPGNQSQMCGGHYTINIFKTGVSSMLLSRFYIINLLIFFFFTLEFIAKVASEPLSNLKHDKPVRIVFLLTLNGRAVRQVYRLIKALFHRDHYFFIHVDSVRLNIFFHLLYLYKQFLLNFRDMIICSENY